MLVKMINMNEINIDDFYKMQPNSSVDNRIFSTIFREEDFYEHFYVCSNKTFERLSSIIKLLESPRLNTMIITGYRGCGKTNFLNFCKSIMENKIKTPQFNNVLSFEIDNIDILMSEKTNKKVLKKIERDYNDSLDKMRSILYDDFFGKDIQYISNNISNIIDNKLKAKCVYINFDAGKFEKKEPLQLKLTRILEELIEHLVEKKLQRIKNEIISFQENNKKLLDDAFENREPLKLKKFFEFLKKNKNIEKYSMIEDELHEELSKLDSDHLLLIINLIQYAIEIDDCANQKYVYFFDNVDFISDLQNNIFYNTIEAFWAFLREMGSLMDSLRIHDEKSIKFKKWLEVYDRTNYIFAMRETTAMHICDHLRDIVKSMADHMDISADVNKSYVFKKRNLFLEKNKLQINNESFLGISNIINKITSDIHFANYLIPLFNNDYRTAVNCLCAVCMENESQIQEALELLTSKQSYCRFGARGIIYRIIFNHFLCWKYFREIGVFSDRRKEFQPNFNNKYKYSFARMILTVLSNKQTPISERFFVNMEESVSIKDLHDILSFIDVDSFISCLDGMYSLRNKTYWNHLITFDNLFSYSDINLKNKLLENSNKMDLKELVLLRTTCAGNIYLNFVCSHFEFFSTRFSKNWHSLFLDDSIKKDQNNKYVFEKTIDCVFESVKECCKNLEKLNNSIFEITNLDISDEELLSSPYFYSKMYHEERIIHQHISYLDAYRLYLINCKLCDDRKNVNIILIGYIQKYLSILEDTSKKYNLTNSLNLCNELGICIKNVVDKDYEDNAIRIDRDYFKEYFYK